MMKSVSRLVAAVFCLATAAACTEEPKKMEEAVTVAPAADANAEKDGLNVDDKTGKVSFKAEVIYFAFDDATLTQEGMKQIDLLSQYLKDNAGKSLTIEGHTDSRGSVEYNLTLGERRGNAIKSYLVTTGVEASRLRVLSFGKEKPAADGETEEAWSKNRRAEFTIGTLDQQKPAEAAPVAEGQ